MRFLIIACFCLSWISTPAQVVETQEQTIRLKIQLHSAYMPQFTVREASDSNVQPLGIRLSASNYNLVPWEIGMHIYGGYDEVARASFGFNFAYLFAERKSHYFKLGLSLSKIDLKNFQVEDEGIGPSVGDIQFTSTGNEFKPYLEWEWVFSRYSSLFVHTGYRFINAERSVVTAVEEVDDPIVDRRVTDREEDFFYSATGFEVGMGLSVNF